MSVKVVFGIAECPDACFHAHLSRDTLVSSSKLCAKLLNGTPEEEDVVLSIPLVLDMKIARLLVSFFERDDIVLEVFAPRVLFDVMLAAKNMKMADFLEDIATEIATRWLYLPSNEIRTQWGFSSNLTAEKQARIALENSVLFRFEESKDPKQKEEETLEDWGWPTALLVSVLEKLPTLKLASLRVVCAEFYDIIHSQLTPHRAVRVKMDERLPHVTLGFAERHCVFCLCSPRDFELVAALDQVADSGPRHVAIEINNEIHPSHLYVLGQLKNLRHLVYKKGDRKEKTTQHQEIQALATVSTLESLVIEDFSAIGAEGAKAVAKLSNLVRLKIGDYNNIGDKGAVFLSALSNLRHLEIGDFNFIGTEGAKSFNNLSRLEYLKIKRNNNIGVEGAKALATITSLQDLTIWDENNIGKEGARVLATLPNLKQLFIVANGNGLERNMEKQLQCLHPNVTLAIF